MRWLIIIFVILLITLPVVSSLQASNITGFEGGVFNLKFSAYINGITGNSSLLANCGNTISSAVDDPFLFSINPAFPQQINKAFSFEISPPLYIDPLSFYNFNSKLNNRINAIGALEDDPVYPELNMKFGQSGGFQNFAYTFPVTNVGSVGIALHKAFYMDFDLKGNGMNGIFEETSSDDTTRVFMNSDLYANLNIDVNSVELAYSHRFANGLNAGLGIGIKHGRISSHATLLINGAIRQLGEEADIYQTFNNPTDAQYFRNTLNDSLLADLNFNLISPVIGFSYYPKDFLLLDLVIRIPTSTRISGKMEMVTHTLGALDEEALINGGDDLIDITLFDPSKMTFTNRIIYRKKYMKLSHPGKFALAFTLDKPTFDLIFSYEKSLGMLSFDYEGKILEDGQKKTEDGFEDYEKEMERDYKLSLDFKHTFKFGVALQNLFGRFDLSGGAQIYIIDYIAKNVNKKCDLSSKKNMLIPSAAGGFGLNLRNDLRYECNLLSFPGPILRSTITYRF